MRRRRRRLLPRAPTRATSSPRGDCDDNNANVQAPGKKEVCGNGLDDDCNGSIDDLCNDCDGDDDCSRDLLVCRNGACAGCARACTAGAACTFWSTTRPMRWQVRGASARNDSCSRCVPMCDDRRGRLLRGRPRRAASRAATAARNNPDVHPAAVEICGNDEDDNCNGSPTRGAPAAPPTPSARSGRPASNRTCEACEATCVVAECRFGEVEGMPGSGVAGPLRGLRDGLPALRAHVRRRTATASARRHPGNEQPGGDCDDANAAAYTGAPEICGNRVDDNCDGRKDEDCAATTCAASATCGQQRELLDR